MAHAHVVGFSPRRRRRADALATDSQLGRHDGMYAGADFVCRRRRLRLRRCALSDTYYCASGDSCRSRSGGSQYVRAYRRSRSRPHDGARDDYGTTTAEMQKHTQYRRRLRCRPAERHASALGY